VEALHQHLWGSHDYALHCPRAAPFAGVLSCTYHHWSKPFSRNRRYCQLPVSGGRMQRFVQVRLGSAYCCWPFGRWSAWAHIMYTRCGGIAVAVQFWRNGMLPCFPQTLTLLRCFLRSRVTCRVLACHCESQWKVLYSSFQYRATFKYPTLYFPGVLHILTDLLKN